MENKQIKKILAENIKNCRSKRGLTQEDAADLAGISVKYWQRLEMTSQVDLPSLPTLFKIAEALKVKASNLLAY